MVTTCPDCSVGLVPQMPEPAEEKILTPDDWVALARLTSKEYADMVEEALRSKDIPVVILSGGGHLGALGQMGSGPILPLGGGFSVMVRKDDAAQADRECQIILGDAWDVARLVDIDES
jgi:hypothetical protein